MQEHLFPYSNNVLPLYCARTYPPFVLLCNGMKFSMKPLLCHKHPYSAMKALRIFSILLLVSYSGRHVLTDHFSVVSLIRNYRGSVNLVQSMQSHTSRGLALSVGKGQL